LTATKLAAALIDAQPLGLVGHEHIYAAGNLTVFASPKIGLICSSQCPGSIVLKTFDLMRGLRDRGVVIVGGFHSPMELECLRILLRGRQPIVLCPARHIDGMLIPKEWSQAFQDRRLLVVSPFGPNGKRITRDLAKSRNRLVAALADSLIVPHASPNSHTLQLAAELLLSGKSIQSFDDVANAELLKLGALQIGRDATIRE
jgi:predicted Rossmann fold nucleotide-binding protein DprA/Smf involved in DNA uptake